jgi:predicted acetyltransferase
MDIRPIIEDEIEPYLAALQYGFYQDAMSPARLERARRSLTGFGIERSWAAFDGGRIVATAGWIPQDMVVPGGRTVPCAGVTRISVQPTHRRRGILTRFISEMHDQASLDGRPLASLWASESVIYGRFGYGAATRYTSMEINSNRSAFRSDAPDPDPIRMVTRDEALEMFPAIADGVHLDRPGNPQMTRAWWELRVLAEPETGPRPRLVVSERNGKPTGFSVFTVDSANVFEADAKLEVKTILGVTPGAWAGLWHFVLNHDLVSKVIHYILPMDDPLLSLLADPRQAKLEMHDGMWMRLLDAGAALEGRAYAAPLELSFEITDAEEGMAKRWRLTSDGQDTKCEPTDGQVDLRLGLEALGSLYLGHPGISGLAGADRVTGDAGGISRMAKAFSWDPLPYCPTVF